ncbi:MAG: GH1 family beta-glucosidase [Planctomycetota bacterium]
MAFRDDFVWGVASASYQVEGAASEGGRTPTVWDMVTHGHPTFKVADGSSGDVACDAYHRTDEDADLIAGLGVQAYRFSLAWSRIMPGGTGEINHEGLDYYKRLIDALTSRGVKPYVTLFHWDYPLCLYDRGGWLNDDSPKWFADYATVVAKELGQSVHHWMTLNEPQCFIGHGHAYGIHAPGLKLPHREVLTVCHNALLAHGHAVQALRAHADKPTIGWAPVGETRFPATDDPADIEAARRETFGVPDSKGHQHGPVTDLNFFNNAWFSDPVIKGEYPSGDEWNRFHAHLPEPKAGDLETIAQPLDFYGVNIYSGTPVKADADGHPVRATQRTGHPRTMMNWTVTPEALYWGPKFIAERYGLPVIITENGCAMADWVMRDGKVHDPGRVDFLDRYISQLKRAAAEGVDIRGYFQWSIMDNFEWGEGYTKRFGLVYVDYETGERIPKDSYHWYKDVVASNGANLGPAEGIR